MGCKLCDHLKFRYKQIATAKSRDECWSFEASKMTTFPNLRQKTVKDHLVAGTMHFICEGFYDHFSSSLMCLSWPQFPFSITTEWKSVMMWIEIHAC